jgi:hypothetical protein
MELGNSLSDVRKWWVEKCGSELLGAVRFLSNKCIHLELFGIFRLFFSLLDRFDEIPTVVHDQLCYSLYIACAVIFPFLSHFLYHFVI